MRFSSKDIKIFVIPLILAVIITIFNILKLRIAFNMTSLGISFLIYMVFLVVLVISFSRTKKKQALGFKVILVYMLLGIFSQIFGLVNAGQDAANTNQPLYIYLLITIIWIALVSIIFYGSYKLKKWGFYIAELFFLYGFLAQAYIQYLSISPLYAYLYSIGSIISISADVANNALILLFFLLAIIYLAKIRKKFTR
jgi:hypothetical protein